VYNNIAYAAGLSPTRSSSRPPGQRHDFIQLPDGYQTRMANGAFDCRGQRQRIAIARRLKDPPIYLKATSSWIRVERLVQGAWTT